MLDFFTRSVQVDCSQSSVSIRYRDRFTRRTHQQSSVHRFDEHATISGMTEVLRAMLDEMRCRRALTTVTLCDAWCRLFVVTPPANALHRRDCDAALSMRFHDLFGDAQDTWIIQADWQLDAPFLCAAMPRALHAALLEIGAQYQLRYTGITPQSIAAWNRWHKQVQKGDWFGVVCEDRLTVISTNIHQLSATFYQRLSQQNRHDDEWLIAYVSREALRRNLPLPARIVLCGDVPIVWMHPNNNSLPCVVLTNTSDLSLDAVPASEEVIA